MTEAEWLACESPDAMLEFLSGTASARKLRLFAVAGCRRIQQQRGVRTSATATEVGERFADGDASKAELAAAFEKGGGSGSGLNGAAARDDPANAARCASLFGGSAAASLTRPAFRQDAFRKERASQSRLLHDMFGNPFRRMAFALVTTADAVSLAHAAYDVRTLPSGELDPFRLSILADALEDAGCTDDAILSHLRSPGPHVRGCWALDLILGKS